MKDLRLAPLRVLWVTLPLTLGPLLAAALDAREHAFRTTVSLLCWIVWAITLVATLVPRVETLTFVRVIAPATVPAAIWATFAHHADGRAAAGMAVAVAVSVAALVAPAGEAFTNGSSYGDERRVLLRPPALLLLGPIELAWSVAVVGASAGPLLLAGQQWIAGSIVGAVGFALAAVSWRALHQLSRRWLVFVPGGLVVHDHLALADPVLFARGTVARIGLAPIDTRAVDLTSGAFGIALEVVLAGPVSVVPVRRDGTIDTFDVEQILVAPSRPGAALAEARRRRMAG